MTGHRHLQDSYKAPHDLADPGDGAAIVVDKDHMVIGLAVAGTETNSLPDPEKPGINLTITAVTVPSGSRAITAATALNQTGNTVMTFAAARDTVSLQSIPVSGGYAWQIRANDGVGLS